MYSWYRWYPKTLFQNYASLKDYKTNIYSDEFIILSMKEIITETYDDIFTTKSDFIRRISYYEESNPNIKKILLKKEFIEKPVSYYTKYPNLLKKIFNGKLKIMINIISEHKNDKSIIKRLLQDLKTDHSDPDITEFLINKYEEDDDSYKEHNDILDKQKQYPSNKELIDNVANEDYKLSLVDYKLLSAELGIGFVLFTNHYTNNDNKFQTYIIIHNKLITNSDIEMICLYEDTSETDNDNKECKQISINDNLIHSLKELKKNNAWYDIYKRTYEFNKK